MLMDPLYIINPSLPRTGRTFLIYLIFENFIYFSTTESWWPFANKHSELSTYPRHFHNRSLQRSSSSIWRHPHQPPDAMSWPGYTEPYSSRSSPLEARTDRTMTEHHSLSRQSVGPVHIRDSRRRRCYSEASGHEIPDVSDSTRCSGPMVDCRSCCWPMSTQLESIRFDQPMRYCTRPIRKPPRNPCSYNDWRCSSTIPTSDLPPPYRY